MFVCTLFVSLCFLIFTVAPKPAQKELIAFYRRGSQYLVYNFTLYGNPEPEVFCGNFPAIRRKKHLDALYMFTVTIMSPSDMNLTCEAKNGIGGGIIFIIQVHEGSKLTC